MGMKQSQSQAQTVTEEFIVKEVQPNGDRIVQYKITGVKVDIDVMGNNVNYDSDNPDAASQAALRDVYGAILNQPIQMTIASDGSIKSVKGAQVLRDNVETAGNKTEMGKQMAQAVVAQYSDETLQNNIRNYFAYFPESNTAVKPGDNWSVDREIVNVLPIQSNTTYTYNRQEGSNIYLDADGTLTADGTVEAQGMSMTADIKGTTNGNVVVDKDTGWLVSSESTQTMNGTMSAQGMDLPMTVASTITIKRM